MLLERNPHPSLHEISEYPACLDLLKRMVTATQSSREPRVQMARELAVRYLVGRGQMQQERPLAPPNFKGDRP